MSLLIIIIPLKIFFHCLLMDEFWRMALQADSRFVWNSQLLGSIASMKVTFSLLAGDFLVLIKQQALLMYGMCIL